MTWAAFTVGRPPAFNTTCLEDVCSIAGNSAYLTSHARWRGSQRNISTDQIRFVTRYGRLMYGDGVLYRFFGQREAKRIRKQVGNWLAEIVDIVVVLTHDGTVLTTYRNHEFPRYSAKKTRRWKSSK